MTCSALFSNGVCKNFNEMFTAIFLWALISSVFLHTIAALYAVCTWRQHKWGRWYPFVIIFMGFLSPLTSGAVTSAIVAGLFVTLTWQLTSQVAFVIGAGQTVVGVGIAFTRILATL